METRGDRPGRADGVPRRAPQGDPTQLALSPAEGYLLSRVDGATPWSVLREIGGLPAERVDDCLERWLADGVLELVVAGGRPAPAGREEAVRTDGAGSAPDPGLDLPVEAQRRILDFESRLERPYHEILGVARDADARAIKRAYFELSKEFHPDRYFRRDIGAFAERLERVFERIAEAYELLSDPTTRAELERSLESEPAPPPVAGAGATAAAARRARAMLHPRHLRALAERKARAKSLFEAGMAAFHAERWLDAACSVRLAIAYDPGNRAFKESFGAVQRRASEERGRQLIREAERALELREAREALRLYEEALHHRPHEPRANYEAACLILALGEDLRRGKEYASRACELEPENGAYHRTLGQIYAAAGLRANAERELRAALRIDPKDAAARAELRALP